MEQLTTDMPPREAEVVPEDSPERVRILQEAFASKTEGYTLGGMLRKAALLILIVASSAFVSWDITSASEGSAALLTMIMSGAIVLALGAATVARQEWSPSTALLFAVYEGVFIGSIAGVFHSEWEGVVTQGIFGTIVVLICVIAITSNRGAQRFSTVVTMALATFIGIAMIYAGTFAFHMVGGNPMYLHEFSSGKGWLLMSFLALTSANLVMHMKVIHAQGDRTYPAYMEWYCAFGLILAVVWF